MTDKISKCLALLAKNEKGLTVNEMIKLMNIDTAQAHELLSYLDGRGLIKSDFGERYKITLDGRVYLESLSPLVLSNASHIPAVTPINTQSNSQNKMRNTINTIKKSFVKISETVIGHYLIKTISYLLSWFGVK